MALYVNIPPTSSGGGIPGTKTSISLGAANQVFSLTVIDGENNGLVVAYGRLLVNAASAVTVLVKINGASTNVHLQEIDGTGASAGAAAGRVAALQNSGAFADFELSMYTAKTVSSLKRAGQIRIMSENGAGGNVQIFCAGFTFTDSSTTITTIDLDSQQASGWNAGTKATVFEYVA